MDDLQSLSDALPAQESPTSIHSLPPETLIHILEFVDALEDKREAICNACLVSRYWCNLAQRVLYRRVRFKECRPDPEDWEEGSTSDEGEVELCPPLMETLAQRPDLREIVRSVVHVGDVYGERELFPSGSHASLVKMFPQMRKLWTGVRSYHLQELTELPYLETLVMSDSTISYTNPDLRFPALRSVKLIEYILDDYLPVHILPHIPIGHLRSLQIRRFRQWSPNVEDDADTVVSEALRPHIPTLENFDYSITDYDNSSPELSRAIDLLSLATRLTNLSIDIYSLEDHLSNLLQTLPSSIVFLKIDFFADPAADLIYRISESCTVAEAILERLLREGDKGLPQLNVLVLTSRAVLVRENDGDASLAEMEQRKQGIIEHHTPLMEELRTRNIYYTSNWDEIRRMEVDDIQYS